MQTRLPGRQDDDLPRAPEGCSSRGPGGRDRDGETTTRCGRHTEPLRLWHPIEVLHFSFRSVDQLEKKARTAWTRALLSDQAEHQSRLDRAYREGRLDAFFESYAVSDPELERGLADGELAIDTRLRDALRVLRVADGTFRTPNGERALAFPPPGVAEQAAYAREASVLVGIDGIVRAEQRVEALEGRLAALPTLPRR